MNRLTAAFSSEARKVLRSKILWISILAFLMIPLVGGFFMFILKDPALARSSGLIGAKAQLAGTADWPSYFQFLSQAVAVGGLVLFGFVSSWIFGREYSDRTIKDLLALPIPRILIVLAKFITVFLWCLVLSLLVLVLGLWVGKIVVLPGWSGLLAVQGCKTFLLCAILTMVLCTPVAFFACWGRGYLTPLGFVVLSLIFAQIVAATGYGQFFPWAVPALLSRVAGSAIALPGNIGYFLVVLTGIAGLIGTSLWWRYADHL
ncbi:MAG TPA: ABC transporter permease [Syntrophomonadaceae bacterium]|nr:ABC transporter permease [Syntrophomonadaceae bacterium]